MSEAKPTPGPWSVWNFSDSQIDVAIGPETGGVAVAQIVTTNAHGIATDQTMATGQANAALLAAAPELLAALKGMLEVFGDEFGMGDSSVCDDARAAIAKATAHKEGQ